NELFRMRTFARPLSSLPRQERVEAGDLVTPDRGAVAVQFDDGARVPDGRHEAPIARFGQDAGDDGARGLPEAFAFQVEFLSQGSLGAFRNEQTPPARELKLAARFALPAGLERLDRLARRVEPDALTDVRQVHDLSVR